MAEQNYNVLEGDKVHIKMWNKHVTIEDEAIKQLKNIASLPFIHSHIAAMPDTHWGTGATVGSVIPSYKAICPANVGVDIGCGMMALRTNLVASDLPDNLFDIRTAIETVVPHGRTDNGGRNDRGAWGQPLALVDTIWAQSFAERYQKIIDKHPKLDHGMARNHMGTLGTGNHFIELCLDEEDTVWVMLHSGSRGVGNRIGTHFINLAKKDMEKYFIHLPDNDLAYLPEGSEHFDDYLFAVNWAQSYARANREVMMIQTFAALKQFFPQLIKEGDCEVAVNCHHNYVSKERHFGKDVWLTRKGAVSAKKDELGIIPGSMGAKSFIVRGLGNHQSFHSCSHGAGRSMSRTKAKAMFTVEDHVKATAGIECRKDAEVIDETPMAYKDIDNVMLSQNDLVNIVHTLRQVICVKG